MRTTAATRRRRVVRAAGALIYAGGLAVGFAAHQLVLSDVRESWAQDDLNDAWRAGLGSLAPTTTTTTAAIATDPTRRADPTPAAEPPSGTPVARLRVPAIGLDKVVLQDVDLAILRSGPGRFPGTASPGQPGNLAIAGHRTTYGAPFRRLDELDVGDDVTVEHAGGATTYRVAPPDLVFLDHRAQLVGVERGHAIVRPQDVWITDPTTDDRVTLVACHPKGSARQRIVVVATRESSKSSATTSSLPITTAASSAQRSGGTGAALLDGARPSPRTAIGWGAVLVLLWAGIEDLRRRIPQPLAFCTGTLAVLAAAWPFYAALELLLPVW